MKPADIAQLDKMVDLLDAFLKACDSNLTDPAEVLRITKEIDKICTSVGVPPEDLPATLKRLVDDARKQAAIVSTLRMDVEELAQKKAQLEAEVEEALRKRKMVYDNIESYSRVKEEAAARYHLDLDKYIGPVAEHLAEAEAKGLSPAYSIPRLKRQAEMEKEDEEQKQKRLDQFEMGQMIDLAAEQHAKVMADRLRYLATMHELGILDEQGQRLADEIKKYEGLTVRPASLTCEDLINALKESNKKIEEGKATAAGADKEARSTIVAAPKASKPDPTLMAKSLEPKVGIGVSGTYSTTTGTSTSSISSPEPAVATSGRAFVAWGQKIRIYAIPDQPACQAALQWQGKENNRLGEQEMQLNRMITRP
jgi:hypothetical protein